MGLIFSFSPREYEINQPVDAGYQKATYGVC